MLIGDAYLIFPERSVVSLLVPNRDVGFQAQGDLAGGKLLYSAGIFNGNPVDGTSSTTDVDTNNGKDLAGRVVVEPFRSAGDAAASAEQLRLPPRWIDWQSERAAAVVPDICRPGYFLISRRQTTADGTAEPRIAGGLSLSQELRRLRRIRPHDAGHRDERRARTVTNQAWGVTASYVLTGEGDIRARRAPEAPFDPAAGTWGAVQVAARYAELTIDGRHVRVRNRRSNASRKAQQLTVGTDWFLNNYVKIYATYERFTFSGGARADENLIFFRTQLAF